MWTSIATPPGPATALQIKASKQPGKQGDYQLAAYLGDVEVHSARFAWNKWLGHCCGQLLMPEFVEAAEHKAGAHPMNRSPNKAHKATWRTENWAKDVPGPVMEETLDNIQTDDKRPPTLAEALKEAQYVLSLYNEGSTLAQEELAGECGPEAQRRAKAEVRKCKAFIAKYSTSTNHANP